jgi:hypothetical protein
MGGRKESVKVALFPTPGEYAEARLTPDAVLASGIRGMPCQQALKKEKHLKKQQDG